MKREREIFRLFLTVGLDLPVGWCTHQEGAPDSQ